MTLFLGISLREMVHKFKDKTLKLLKLILLEKRLLFFGHKVESIASFQYGLVSLIPELFRHLEDVASPSLDWFDDYGGSRKGLNDAYKTKLKKLGHPLRIFGLGTFFQPYIPLQQMDLLLSPNTKSFITGTTNNLFVSHRGCKLDVIAHVNVFA